MRIVSLCPSLTELVFELGLGTKLVGVTEYCIRPPDGVLGLCKVGGTKDPNLARIAALRPDLVLMNEEENRLEDAEELARLGIETHSSFPCTVAETATTVRQIGKRLSAAAAAERIADGIEVALARAVKATAGRPPLRFAYLIWRRPWMTAAEGTYVSSLLEAAGGDNVVGPCPTRYPAIGEDQLAAANPGAVLLATEPFPFQPKHVAELSLASGISACRFRIADGELLSWHGARTAAGLEYAVRLLDELRGAPLPQRAN